MTDKPSCTHFEPWHPADPLISDLCALCGGPMQDHHDQQQEADRIRAMVAGRDLDVEIARGVFGVEVQPECRGVLKTRIWDDPLVHCNTCGLERAWNAPGFQTGGRHDLVPRYSTTWGGVGLIVKQIQTLYPFALYPTEDADWVCVIGNAEAKAETAPLAVCRAALLATMASAGSEGRE